MQCAPTFVLPRPGQLPVTIYSCTCAIAIPQNPCLSAPGFWVPASSSTTARADAGSLALERIAVTGRAVYRPPAERLAAAAAGPAPLPVERLPPLLWGPARP